MSESDTTPDGVLEIWDSIDEDHHESVSAAEAPCPDDHQFRVIGRTYGDRVLILHDIDSQDTVWTAAVGYPEALQSVIDEIQGGNLLEASLTTREDPEVDAPFIWEFSEVVVLEESRLDFIETNGFTVGPVQEFWERERSAPDDIVSITREESSPPMLEVQVQRQFYETADGELDLFVQLRKGGVYLEECFTGSRCDYLQDGASAILAVNPTPTPYLVFYLFAEVGEEFQDLSDRFEEEIDPGVPKLEYRPRGEAPWNDE